MSSFKFFENRNLFQFLLPANRGADLRRGQRKQAQLDCGVHGVRPSTLFWRVAPGQGTGRSQHRDSRRRSRREQGVMTPGIAGGLALELYRSGYHHFVMLSVLNGICYRIRKPNITEVQIY